jgi:hypothetical protein
VLALLRVRCSVARRAARKLLVQLNAKARDTRKELAIAA